MKFYDRENELAELKRIQTLAFTEHSRLTVVTGRRRIGKTSLVMKAVQGSPTVYLFVSRKNEASLCAEYVPLVSQALDLYVPEDIKTFLPATLELILFAAILEIVGGIGLGVACARRAGGVLDNSIRVVSYLGIATPSYVWAIFFMLIFCYWVPVLPTIGRISASVAAPASITGFYLIDSLLTGNFTAFWDVLKHLVMPGTALALTGIAQSARITRSSMLDNMSKDFVGAEISSGIPMRKVMWQYVLRPSAAPSVSIIALDIAAMLGNAFVVEQVFSYPGVSKYCLNAILNKDLNAIVGVVMVIGVSFLVVNILVDIISAFLDPRNRL